ncbi:14 kDa phosphohistidine phosphatase-like [Mantella aurantiaca]
MAHVDSVEEVQIDPQGVFKYILIRVSAGESGPHRHIVRGTKSAEYHNHIFDKVNPEIQALGLQCECLGGGKIEHNSAEKKIRVYGESTGYGRADHSITAEKLRHAYKDYEVVCEDKK